METKKTTAQPTFVTHQYYLISIDYFVDRVKTLKEMSCNSKTTLLKLIASVDVKEMSLTQNDFQELILFVTECSQVIEKTIITKA